MTSSSPSPSRNNRSNGASASSSAAAQQRSSTIGQRLAGMLRSFLHALVWPILGILRLLLLPARSAYGDEYDGLSAAVTAKASQQFVSYLRGLYQLGSSGSGSGSNTSGNNSGGSATGGGGGAWLTTGFAAAQEQATQQQSLLLVYLHSPLHGSSEHFCRTVLCSESMSNFMNQPKITALGVSIHTAQGAYLAQLLGASCYPFLALLQPHVSTTASTNTATSNSTMTLLLRAEGPVVTELSVQQIMPHFQTALQRHQQIVAEAESRRLQRQEESDLRRMQDEEYQAALMADQERERQQREEQEREAKHLRELQEAAERQEAEATAVLDQAKQRVPEEPPALCDQPVTTIRFVLPTGTKLLRRFYSNESIAGLLAFLTIHFHENNLPISKNIGLSTNFPKKSYHEDPALTLEKAGLAPQAVLMVQDLDA